MRRTLDALRKRYPTAYWRARNGAALVQLYAARWTSARVRDAAYDDGFWNFHATGDWDGFARAVLAATGPVRSVVDVGCGQGLTLAGFARVDAALRLRGFDGSPPAIARAVARGLPVDRLDLMGMSESVADATARQVTEFDLAICLEVAEHVPAWHSGKLLTIVSAAPRLVFSAAHPNQGGRFHVNEQPPAYWIDRLAVRGLELAAGDQQFRAAVAALALPWWYGQNIHLFERRGDLSGAPGDLDPRAIGKR